MSETWRELRGTFDTAAATYDRARPDYPDAVYADLVALAGLHEASRLLPHLVLGRDDRPHCHTARLRGALREDLNAGQRYDDDVVVDPFAQA